jgi:hypothetical protein
MKGMQAAAQIHNLAFQINLIIIYEHNGIYIYIKYS